MRLGIRDTELEGLWLTAAQQPGRWVQNRHVRPKLLRFSQLHFSSPQRNSGDNPFSLEPSAPLNPDKEGGKSPDKTPLPPGEDP